jgi:DNA (cytosine-5)-methyltransferase 1
MMGSQLSLIGGDAYMAGTTPRRPIRVRDTFAGVGFAVACDRLGWDEDGWEIMPEARASRDAAGFKTPGHDVRKCEPVEGEYDLDISAPPCPTFSMCGKGTGRRHIDLIIEAAERYKHGLEVRHDEIADIAGDPRTALVLETLRIALAGMSPWLLWKQVPTVLPIWKAFGEVLHDRGYSVACGILNAADFGVPQFRKRAVLVARRDGRTAKLPEPTHARHISMAEGIGWGLTARPSYTVTGGGTDTGGADPFGNAARQGMHKEIQAGRWKERPGGDPDGWAKTRPSIRDVAVLQSFPANFPFQGRAGRQYQQIGNAFPPDLALAALRTFQA